MQYTQTRESTGTNALRTLLAIVAAIAVAACTSMKAYSGDDYERGAATSEQFYKASRACDKEAEAHGKEHGLGPYDPTHGAYNLMFDACMRSSGYTRKKAVE